MAVLCIAPVALASCSGVQSQPGETAGALPPAAREATNEASLYLSNVRTNDVDIYSYPAGRMVGKLTGFGKPRSECTDAQGDVWIADPVALAILEYAPGTKAPIAALSTPGAPNGCSVSPVNGDLAVTGGHNGVVVAVFHRSAHNHWRDQHDFTDTAMRVGYFCGYDARGNLFVDGLSTKRNGSFRLAELPHRATALVDVAVKQQIAMPGQVQWDGRHIAIGDSGVKPSVVYQFSIGGSGAKMVGATTLDGTTSVRQFWIDGTSIIGPDFGKNVGVWNYPQGGARTKTIDVTGFGAAVSK